MNGSSTDTLRAFIAARPNEAAQAELVRVQRELKKQLSRSGLRIKWTALETFHITLLFLGDIPASQIGEVFQTLEKTMQEVPIIGTALTGAGLFKKSGALWVGINSSPELIELQKSIATALDFEPGRFHAHFTLGRIKTGRPDSSFSQTLEKIEMSSVSFTIRELELVKSELLAGGARHTVLGVIGLCGDLD